MRILPKFGSLHLVALLCVPTAVFACSSDDTSEGNAGGSGGQGGSAIQASGGTQSVGGKNSGTGGGVSSGGSTAGRGGQSNAGSGGSSAAGSNAGGSSQGGTSAAGSSAVGGTTSEGGKSANTFTDTRDGQSYPTLTLGSQTWLAKNLNYAVEGSFCYEDKPANCNVYGRLYTWSAAQTACPSGYRLGTDDDWKTLETTLGMASNQLNLEGYSTERGTDQGAQLRVGGSSGFNAPLAGFRSGNSYEALGDRTYLWTATTRSADVWRRRITGANATIYRFTNPAGTFAISVRCVKN